MYVRQKITMRVELKWVSISLLQSISVYLSISLYPYLYFFFLIIAYIDLPIYLSQFLSIYQLITLSHSSHIYLSIYLTGYPRGVMVKAMDCGIVVSEFVLQSRY